jgi:hypothetical protein
MRLASAVFVALALQSTAALAATEYVYRLDNVEELPVHVEGAVAVVDIPSIADGARRLEQSGVEFRPSRIMYDGASGRFTMIDVARKKLFAMTRQEMRATKLAFLRRYWDSKRAWLATLKPEDRAAAQRAFDEKLAHPSVTTFGPPRGPHAPSPGGECELVEYTTDGKVGGDAHPRCWLCARAGRCVVSALCCSPASRSPRSWDGA